MHRTTITLTVLSEDPIPDRMDIAEVVHECTEGAFVLAQHRRAVEEELSGKQMADALKAAGSDPGFFNLNDDGEKEEQ